MKINTIGRIILKDGKLVFERFGSTVKQKIKLGTAAFANIVNNATTTEEGFVPDARVVAQQQETISELQEQVESLNSAIQISSESIQKPSTNVFASIDLWSFYCYKFGKVVSLVINISGTMKATTDYAVLFSVPEQYRPKTVVVQNFLTAKGEAMGLYVNSNGNFALHNNNKEISGWPCRQVVTYVIN